MSASVPLRAMQLALDVDEGLFEVRTALKLLELLRLAIPHIFAIFSMPCLHNG